MNIYILAFLLLSQLPFGFDEALELPQSSSLRDPHQNKRCIKAAAANIIFKSTDGGQTWQDISEGLPENLQGGDIRRNGFVVNESGLHLRAATGIYHSKLNSTAPFWQIETVASEHNSFTTGSTRISAYNYERQFLQKSKGTSVWSSAYTNFEAKEVLTFFETAGGTVFIGCDYGLFRSPDNGKTWNKVHTPGWMTKMVESNRVLMATSQRGILRSTDDGENWDYVISEGGVGIAVESIKGGFAAITFNTSSQTRRVRTSYDNGKTWQPIDAGLPANLSIASIIEVGDYFFCGHPDGIFRSSDKGKTWKLLLPSIENKVFNLFVSGNVIYAIPLPGGC